MTDSPGSLLFSTIHRVSIPVLWICLAVGSVVWTPARATGNVADRLLPGVEPVEDWAQYKKVHFRGKPVLVHLRTGYQRPVIMPEPVDPADPASIPAGCKISVEAEIVMFSPASHFTRQTITFVGRNSGIQYQLKVRSSVKGKRIPIHIVTE